jgi:hypothetical protein
MKRSTLAGLAFVASGLVLITLLDVPAWLTWWVGSCLSLAGVAFAISAAISAWMERDRR